MAKYTQKYIYFWVLSCIFGQKPWTTVYYMGAKLRNCKDDGMSSSCGNNVCAGAEFSICFHQNENETAHSSFCQSDMLSSREQGRRTHSVFNIHSNHWAASMFRVCFNKWTSAEVRKSHFPNKKGKQNLLALGAFMLNVFDSLSAGFLGKHSVSLQSVHFYQTMHFSSSVHAI